jgi:ATP-dependent Clp protease ATP-binding subunit ClpB
VLRKRLVRLPQIDPAPDSVFPSKDFTSVIKKAQTEQKRRQDAYLGVDVLLLALLHDAEVAAAISEAGMAKQALENALKEVRPEVRGAAGRRG